MHHPRYLIPRSRLVAFDPTLLMRLLNDAAGLEPVARQLAFPVDIGATDDAYTVKVDVPGVTRDQIRVEAVEQQLTVSIDKSETHPDPLLHHRERWRTHGQRQFKLPADAQADRIHAALAHGVLTITLPRQQPEAPQVHTVTISEETPEVKATVNSPAAE